MVAMNFFFISSVTAPPANSADRPVSGLADEPRPVDAAREVTLHEAAADLAGDVLALRTQVVDDDLRAFLGEAPRDARAEARRRAGDDRHLAFEPHVVSLNGLCSASSLT